MSREAGSPSSTTPAAQPSNSLPSVALPPARMCDAESAELLAVLSTGGTIDKDYPRTTCGYAFEFGDVSAVQRVLMSMPMLGMRTEFTMVCAKDSTEIEDADREALCRALARTAAERVVVTHGTDTMIETARYVLRRGSAAGKRVVFTGAMKPERFKDSDASFNLGGAVAATALIPVSSVFVCMNGLVVDCIECARDDGGRFLKITL